jgi:hypothetical protein
LALMALGQAQRMGGTAMVEPASRQLPAPTLSELMDQAAAERSGPEIRGAARVALKTHAPDREPLTWIKRWGVLPWLQRNRAECLHCGNSYPCITHRYATQLLSAGRLADGRVDAVDNTGLDPRT